MMIQTSIDLSAPRIDVGVVEPGKVVAVIPAYNEERFIASTVFQALEQTSCVIVVDDGSQDETGKLARQAGAIVIEHTRNCGKGAALNTGLRAAFRLEPQAVVLLDADGQHRAREMVHLLAPIFLDQADIVVGSRYLGKGSCVPGARLMGHRLFNFLTLVASGQRVSDSQCGFRAISGKVLASISFCSNGFAVESEMQFLAREHGLRIREVQITVLYADKPKRPLWVHGLLVLGGVIRLTIHYRPLLSYGLAGMILFLFGSIYCFQLLQRYSITYKQAVFNLVISVAVMFVGGILSFIGLTLHHLRSMLHKPLKPYQA